MARRRCELVGALLVLMTINRRFYSPAALLLSDGIILPIQDDRSRVSLADAVEPNSAWENFSMRVTTFECFFVGRHLSVHVATDLRAKVISSTFGMVATRRSPVGKSMVARHRYNRVHNSDNVL